MPVLTFRRDSRVHVREHGEPDAFLDPEDPFAPSAFLGSPVEFEPGLTAGGLIRCLRPWAALAGRLAWMDFDAWSAVAATAHLRDAAALPDDGEPRLSEIVLAPHAELLDGELRLGWECYGLTAPGPDGSPPVRMSFSMSPATVWVGLPVRIDRRCRQSARPRRRPRRDERFIADDVTVTPTLFDTVMLGFLDEISAYGDPEDTEAAAGLVTERMAEVEELLRETPETPFD
jgi:hypothetical protein